MLLALVHPVENLSALDAPKSRAVSSRSESVMPVHVNSRWKGTSSMPATLAALTVVLSFVFFAAAQVPGDRVVPTGSLGQAVTGEEFDFYAYGPYREGIPRPSEILGYEMGQFHARYGLIERYFDELARAAPERIVVQRIGETYERRPLILGFIGSPEVLDRREEIRETLERLADPRRTSREEAARFAAETPILVWLNYGTDGEESAATEAAMQVAYQLVAGESEEMRLFRSRTLVILVPVHNPESHQRFVAWYNAFGIGDEDPNTLEKSPPWAISNDNNRYQIDLNRDAHSQTQRESQAWGTWILRWKPQVFVDHHGQTSTYYFPPPVLPVNPDLPAASFEWMVTFGRGNAQAFDRYGWQYWSRDSFDHFYPGYWETWPSLLGATGMTYETTGGGTEGLRQRRPDGTLLTLRLGIAQHFVASLATLSTAVEHREARLLAFHDFFRGGMEEAVGAADRVVILDGRDDPRRAAVLVSHLLRHGIEVRRAETPFQVRAAGHQSGDVGTRSFPSGTYLVDLAQPQARIASTLLRPHRPVEDSFRTAQFARWSRNARRGAEEPKEGYEFYDVKAWSFPVQYGVPAFNSEAVPAVETRPVEVAWDRLATSGDWSDEVLIEVPESERGGVEAGRLPEGGTSSRARNSYLWGPETEGAMRLAAALMKEGYVVNSARHPIVAAGEEHAAGTFVVRVERNPDSIHERIAVLAREAGVRALALHTGFQERGQYGVGANPVVPLRAPRVLVLADDGVSETSYGATWFTLERRLGYPFTPMRFAQWRRANLSGYDVIVLVDGSEEEYARRFGEDGIERLRNWIRGGGTLVTWGGGAALAIRKDLLSAGIIGRGDPESEEEASACLAAIDALVPDAAAGGPPRVSPTARPCAFQPLSGSVLRVESDPTHWLAAGTGGLPIPVLVRGPNLLTLSERGANPLTFADKENLWVGGFVWPENTDRWVPGQAYAVVDSVGNGFVIAFSTDPNFRAQWRSTSRFFANAVLLGPSMGAAGGRAW
jgi:hypothetical protein